MDDNEELGSEEELFYEALESTCPENIIELEHSFGYNSKRLFNLVLIDPDTLVFASGNYLHYFNVHTRKITLRGSELKVGIGFITKNEHPDHVGLLTVGENGPKATVFIYEYPEHNVRVKLEGAAKASFTCGAYNSTGELFASQAGAPDFTLTIWRWEKAEKILRSRAFQNDVLYVHFSKYNPKLLVSCGLSHIKFWKMAHTFTGLKLQGDLGRFGKTDFSDIYAAYILPDENVISGCEWGNILLWEAGLIKFEITRKGRRPCHDGPIMYISMSEGEVTTIAMDGFMRLWFWETVDLADPPDDDRFVEIEPIYEIQVGNCEIRGLARINPFDENNFEHYAQDGRGGIWYCDFSILDVPKPELKIFSAHDGRVVAAQASPISQHLLTLGEGGKVSLWNVISRKSVYEKKYKTLITSILWCSTRISNTGSEILIGFADGVVRLMLMDLKQLDLHLLQAVKGHTASVLKMAFNSTYTILLVGSADSTVFIHNVSEKVNNFIHIIPLGFIPLSSIPNFINWRTDMTALIGSRSGEVFEFNVPHVVTEEETYLSYELNVPVRTQKFVSIKSRIRRDLRREEIKRRKLKKRARKMKEIGRLMKANPGLQIDIEAALADSEPDEEEPPLYIPAKPNPVLWLKLTENGTIWVSMGGYDAGYIYELEFGFKEPVASTIIPDGDDIEINSYIDLPDYSIHGLINGCLRINKINQEDYTDLSDYRLFRMHDHLNGRIASIVMSYDGTTLFSVGHDGNIFMYKWNGPIYDTFEAPRQSVRPKLEEKIEDILDEDYPSLEQEKILAEKKRQEDAARAHENKVRGIINDLADEFHDLYAENHRLHEDLRLQHRDMLLDERILKEISDELQFELDEVRDDLAYDLEVAQVGKTKLYNHFLKELDHIPIMLTSLCLEPIDTIKVYSFAMRALGEDFQQCRRDIEERLRLEAAQRGEEQQAPTEIEEAQFTTAEEKEERMPQLRPETFFFGRDPKKIVPRFSRKMLRLLRRYRARQRYEVQRIYNWEKLIRRKPDPNVDHPDDVKKIQEAEKNLGDYKLKVGDDYETPTTENLTNKYIETVDLRENMFHMLSDFNQCLFALRDKKSELYENLNEYKRRIELIHKLLPKECWKYMPDLPDIVIDEEHPDENLIEKCTPGCGIEISDIIYLEKTVTELLPKKIPPLPVEKIKAIERHDFRKYTSVHVQDAKMFKTSEEVIEFITSFPDSSDFSYFYSTSRDEPVPWFELSQFYSLLQLLEEQDNILFMVNRDIDRYNKQLKDLHWMRSHIKLESQFMHSYMITLNQELMILRDSEQIENNLIKNAEDAMKTRNQMQVTINNSNRMVEESKRTSEKLNDQIASVVFKFMSTIKGHKFYDFLRRIFKKKYKPPKPERDENESSESSSDDESSSEDENDDTKSIDSGDITAIRLDESSCPPGLERATYDLAFNMRAQRHALEAALLEQQKIIDTRRAEVAELHKQMKYHEDVYAHEKETLQLFRRKRQQEINKVKVSVVLDMTQMQYFREGKDYRDLSKAVLFDSSILTKLQNRVDQLKQETLETKRWHRINFIHLRRMNTDINFMHFEIIRLEEEIRTAMMKKFGMIVPLDELEESVLGKYVFAIETTAEEELRAINKEMEQKKQELAVLYENLIFENKANIEKMNILGVLQQDLNFLNEVLIAQERHYEKGSKPFPYDLDKELEKLIVIDKQQKEQMECLEREICTLRMKAKPFQMNIIEPTIDLSKEYMQPDDVDICPDVMETHAYNLRITPDEFIMDRVLNIVKKCFVQAFGDKISKEQVRRYAHRVSRYLGQVAYSFEGSLSERILDCIIDSLQDILPKKYMLFLSREDVQKMFNEILAAFDYERSEINTEDLISGIFGNALEAVNNDVEIHNKTQVILENIFKELIEVLPLEEFESPETRRALIDVLSREAIIEPRCISVENFMLNLIRYAEDNLLDNITAIPLRRLVEAVTKELMTTKACKIRCALGSVNSVQILEKKRSSASNNS